MKWKRTFKFKKTEYPVDGSYLEYRVVKDSYIMEKVLTIAEKMGVQICKLYFPESGYCAISAKEDKIIWYHFCQKIIETLDDYIEKYIF